ncbi:MAG TPA: hypothetical protein VNZ49_07290 [Bacteroidia bacterium]|jgi:hypothetical protein|nr:hypothetical protein [Bacteroidia bacterium]
MENNGQLKNDKRLSLIQEQLIKFVRLDFSGNLPVSEKGDDIDAIIIGMNTLGEELNTAEIIKSR